jgi:signal transduction histidine kinase/ActR/RegA family two-component response regulator
MYLKEGHISNRNEFILLEEVANILATLIKRKEVEEEKQKLWKQLLQSQKMESIGRLSGGIAHDFNNILTGVLGYAKLSLNDISDDHPAHRKIKVVISSSEKAVELIQKLLVFSRKQVLKMRPANLNTIVEHMSDLLMRVISEDVKLQLHIKKPVLNVVVDETQIQQVIMNLAVNARDAMPGGGQLTIRTENVELERKYTKTHQEAKPGPYVMLSVADTGIGMTMEEQEKIFEPFYTTKEKGKGSGLGLSTVFGIIKQHSGSIMVYSEPGKGSVFKVYLPATKSKVVDIKKDKVIEVKGRKETILVVDDDEIVRNFSKDTLEPLNYKIIEARSAEEALEIIDTTKEKIDLMLTDVILTGMSGWELAKKVNEKRPKIKIIFTSGYMDNPIVLYDIMKQGAPFINKPFAPEALAKIINEILEEKK